MITIFITAIFSKTINACSRHIVKNAVGIFVEKCCVFEILIPCDVSSVDKITISCCALHNWLKITNKIYISQLLVDEENIDEYKII